MTISSTVNRNDYVGNGATSVYAYSYRIIANTDLLVTVRNLSNVETTLALTTDYTVSGVGSATGGNVTLVNASQAWLTGGNLTTDFRLTIRRVRPITQTTDIRNQGDFFPETHEDAFDHFIMIDQQNDNNIDGSMRLPETVSPTAVSTILPVPAGNKSLRWNAGATALENFDLASQGSLVTPGSNGLLVYQGTNILLARTLTAGAIGAITVTNGDGVAGNPTVAVDITGATALTAPATGDELLIYDLSATAIRKITLGNFVTGQVAETAPDGADEALIYDASATATRKMTLSNLLVNGHVALTAPVAADSALVYDLSATNLRKVTLDNLLMNGYATIGAQADADTVLLYDASAAALNKQTLQNLLIGGWSTETVSATNDQALIYDSSAAALKKIDLSNLLPATSVGTNKLNLTLLVDTDVTVSGAAAQFIAVETRSSETANGTPFVTEPYIISLSPKTNPGTGANTISFEATLSVQMLANDNASVETLTRTEVKVIAVNGTPNASYVARLKVWKINP